MLLAARALPTVASKQQEQCHISTTLRERTHEQSIALHVAFARKVTEYNFEACPAPTPLYTVLTILDITQPQYIIYTHSNAGSFVTADTTAGATAAGLLSIAVASLVAVGAVFVVAIEVVVSLSAAAAAAAGCGATATFIVRYTPWNSKLHTMSRSIDAWKRTVEVSDSRMLCAVQAGYASCVCQWLAVAPNCLCDEKIVAALAAHCERSASNGTLLL
eukprot:2818-Heterococcus_DN1.PRE.2